VIREFFSAADGILRDRSEAAAARHWLSASLFVVVFGSCYGALMGTFGGIGGDRLLQVLYSALKVPLLLLFTFVVALPSFFVLNTLFGLRSDFPAVLTALVSTQAGLTIVLLSFSPYTLFWYASSADYNAAILFHALIFGLAAFTGQWLLRRRYRVLIAANPRHRTLLRFWLILYAFVGIQSAWVLRPFIGNPGMRVQFFREEAWGNAYVEVAHKVRDLFQ
jgi:ABC-type dipeptide/oligopeptide/nickel transport system permease subunit